MARIRTIKPDFFISEHVADLPPLHRLLFVGLWTQADREGLLEDRPKRLWAALLPYDQCDVNAMLDDLVRSGLIIRYEVDGLRLICIPKFLEHQMPHYREPPSALPHPPGHSPSGYCADAVTPEQRARVLGPDAQCAHCGTQDNLTIDHIIPRKRGGTSADDNLQALCQSCNSSKQARSDEAAKSKRRLADVAPSLANHEATLPQPSLIIDPTLTQPSRSPSLGMEGKGKGREILPPAARKLESVPEPEAFEPDATGEYQPTAWGFWGWHNKERQEAGLFHETTPPSDLPDWFGVAAAELGIPGVSQAYRVYLADPEFATDRGKPFAVFRSPNVYQARASAKKPRRQWR